VLFVEVCILFFFVPGGAIPSFLLFLAGFLESSLTAGKEHYLAKTA